MGVIQIPKKVYVGFQGRRTQDEVPLGFMVPYGEDDGGMKRQATVDKWAKNVYGNAKTFNSVVIDNAPMVGFKLGRSVRRSGWNGGGATYFRIEDPRGFELEISIENFGMIASSCILEKGEIMQECVWGRDGRTNILVPTNTEPYTNAVILPDDDEKVDIASVARGDVVRIATGETGVWLGMMTPINLSSRTIDKSARRNVLRQELENGVINYVTFGSTKVVKVLSKAETTMSDVELETMIANDLKTNPFAISGFSDITTGDSHIIALVVGSRKLVIDAAQWHPVQLTDIMELCEMQKKSPNSNMLTKIKLQGGKEEETLVSMFRADEVIHDSQWQASKTDGRMIPYANIMRSYGFIATGKVDKDEIGQFEIRKIKITSGTGVVFDVRL